MAEKIQTAFTKNDVIAMIAEGVTKSAKSPNFDENIGTFLTRMNITQSACVGMFMDNPDLEKAYLKKHRPTTQSGKAVKVVFGAAPVNTANAEIPETYRQDEELMQEAFNEEAEELVEDAIYDEDGLSN
jgi:hypothetical protein